MEHSHIKVIKNHSRIASIELEPDTYIRKTSFAIETAASLEQLSLSELPDTNTLTNNLQGGTFAQRARAAELQAARARKESKSKTPQDTPSSSPRGTITLKMPKRQKWTPLDLSSNGAEAMSFEPELDISADVSTQASPDEQPHLLHHDQSVPDYDLSHDLHRLNINRIPSNNAEHYSAKLFGSRPTSTLQSHDLAEYPAELGARIAEEAPARLDRKYHTLQDIENGYPSMTPLQVMKPMDASSDEEANVERLQQLQQSQIMTLQRQLSLTKREHQELIDSLSKPRFMQSSMAQQGQPSQQNGVTGQQNGVNGQYNGFPDYFSSEPIRQSAVRAFPAVRGTPAATDTNIRPIVEQQSFYNDQTTSSGYTNDQGQNPYSAQNSYVMSPDFQNDDLCTEAGTRNQQAAAEESHTVESHREMMLRSLNNIIDESVSSQPKHRSRPTMSNGTRQWPYDPVVFNIHNPPAANDSTRRGNIGTQRPGHGIWRPEGDRKVPAASGTKPREELSREQQRELMEKEMDDWWQRDSRITVKEAYTLKSHLEHARNSYQNQDEERMAKLKGPDSDYTRQEMSDDLLLPVIANLIKYKTGEVKDSPFSPPPSWVIDHTAGGNNSFFSQYQGTPPQRVGRDPRYRAMQHDGRSSVFEDPTGRFPRGEFSHGRRGWTGF